MSIKTITWSDGSTSTVSYTGSGDQTISIGHAANTGIDRTASITVAGGGQSVAVSLKQYGQCELCVSSNSRLLRDSESSTLTVEKTDYDTDGAYSIVAYTLSYTTAEINAILAKIDAM